MSDAGSGTVGKALNVLDIIATLGKPVRFADLQRLSPLPKATLYRLVQTLVKNGMIVQNPETGAYSLGVRLVRLAHAAWRTASLGPIARPHLHKLSQDSGFAAHLAQLDFGHVLVVDRHDAQEPDARFGDAGRTAPAYCTGVGKAILAFLDPDELNQVLAMQSFHRFTSATLTSEAVLRQSFERIRERGYAIDREEHLVDVICVAAPILAAGGRVLGAVSVSASQRQTNIATLEARAPRLRACAEEIAAEASHWAFPVETPAE